MAETRVCPTCGSEFSAESLSGLCPRCLLAAGLESQAASGASQLPPTQSSPHGSPHGGFAPPSPEELAGRFPQLELMELLGKGGMGAVYKARQTGLDRLVALKILPTEVSGEPGFAERFTREARALARLSHPHIVTVYDFGQADGLYYLVMEYVDGVNLRDAMRSGVMPEQALGIVPQVCEALQFAHDEGVVHRDVKPENILLDKRGRVKIADFGLAKLLGADAAATGLTGTHHVMGTWRYMAPEQMEATRNVDHRADIYSLGVVFYELLTGDVPMGRFQPPSAKVQVDVRIDEVVLKALEREPERRYQQASEVKTDIEAITGSVKSEQFVAAPTPELIKAEAARLVQNPAWGLIITGVISWMTIPLAFWIPMQRELNVAQQALVQISFGVIPLVVGTTMALAGFQMKRLEGYRLALAASVLPIAVLLFKLVALPFGSLAINPADLVGVPMGLWALVTLTRREVKEQFHRGSNSLGIFRRPGWTWVDTILVGVLAIGAVLAAAPGYMLDGGTLSHLESERIRWTTQVLWTQARLFIFFALLGLGLRAPHWLPLRGGKLGTMVGRLWTRLPRAIRIVVTLGAAVLLYLAIGASIGAVRQAASDAQQIALERLRNADEVILHGETREAESAAQAYLALAEGSNRPYYFGPTEHNANVLLGFLALYRGDVAVAAEKLRAASRSPRVETVSNDLEGVRLAGLLASLGERRAPAEYLRAVKRGSSNPRQMEDYAWRIEQGEFPISPLLDASGRLAPVEGAWVVGVRATPRAPVQDMWVFSRDGGLFTGGFSRVVKKFRRDGDKIVFDDGKEAVVRTGKIEPPSDAARKPFGALTPIFQEDQGRGLEGRWIATLRRNGEALVETAWTFDADDSGKCTMDIPTLDAKPDFRCAFVGDHLLWTPAPASPNPADAPAVPERIAAANWLVARRDGERGSSHNTIWSFTALSVGGKLPGSGKAHDQRLFRKLELVHDGPYEDVPE